MSEDRTEKPTAKRMREAREKGQLPRSRDLGQAAALLASVGVLAWTGRDMVMALNAALTSGLVRMGQSPMDVLGAKEVAAMVVHAAFVIARVCGPVAAATVIAVIAVQTAQGGVVFATEAATPDFGRLNPVNGLKRLGFSTGGVELLKALFAAVVLAVLGWQAVDRLLLESLGLAQIAAVPAAAAGWDRMVSLLWKVAIALIVLAAFDYGVQRWQFMRGKRMSKQEVKDEHRLQEGSPEVKGRIRRIQRDIVRRRMMAAVKQATVVVTNPTHFAVALEYNKSVMAAPRVVAKGRGFVALRIRELAREHGVPIVENPPLARALHKHAEVGDVIPAALFEAVAEVLAYLIRMRQLIL